MYVAVGVALLVTMYTSQGTVQIEHKYVLKPIVRITAYINAMPAASLVP